MSTVTFNTSIQDQLKFVEQRIREQAGDEQHPDLRSALEHIIAAGGKRIRPTLGLLVGNMLGAPEEKLVTLGASVELLHTATLVHDDLIDGALLRRGMPTLNARWSPAATVLTGDFLFARAAKHEGYQLTVDLKDLRVSDDHGLSLAFDVDDFRRHCLLNGLDQIDLTLENEAKITEYEQARGIV